MFDFSTILLLLAVSLLIMFTAFLYQLHREQRRTVRSMQALESYRIDLTNFARLMKRITGADWQGSVQVLLSEVVALGYARSVILLTVGDHGLEVCASASAPHASEWDVLDDPIATEVRVEGRQLLDRANGRLYMPVQDGGEVIGVLVASGIRLEDTPHTAEMPFMEAMGHLIGFVQAVQRALQKQVALSTTDGLTGLMNHRHFQQVMGVNLAQTYLQATPLSVLIFDLDNFKSVNDTHGHLFGDLVLREIANIARRIFPPDVPIARYGGEEFAVLLPGRALADAAELAERLRAEVAAHPILDFATSGRVQVTISVGVSTYALGQGKSRFLQRADEALYASKRNGKNRVTVSAEDELAPSQG